MACFSYTCGVSGLPIGAGDRVRFMMLVRNPYDDDRGIARSALLPQDRWCPRTFPLKARYDDYGSVEDVEERFQQSLWLKGLQLDLIEQGVGDSCCHGKDMTFDQLLEALWEGRLLVKDSYQEAIRESRDLLAKLQGDSSGEGIPDGIPTMKRVVHQIEMAGLRLSSGGFDDGYLVDDLGKGLIRIRWGGFEGQEEALSLLQPHLKGFATMMTSGQGAYSHETELLTAPLPGCKGYIAHVASRLPLAQMMIREDVWQLLLSLSDHEINQHLEDLLQLSRIAPRRKKDPMAYMTLIKHSRLAPIAEDPLPFVTGWGTHLLIALDSDADHDEKLALLRVAAETLMVDEQLYHIRHVWSPGSTAGSQSPEWDRPVLYHQGLLAIARRELRER